MVKRSDDEDVAKVIRKKLKLKFPSVKFSVRTKHTGTSASIRINWHEGPALKKVKEIVSPYEFVYRDERTGEILAGGNRYVFCERDIAPETFNQVEQEIRREFKGTIEQVYIYEWTAERIAERDL